MTKKFFRIGFFSLLSAALIALPVSLSAQSTNKVAAATKKEAAKGAKKPGAGPFHGKLAALDKNAKTITVGTRTFQITSQTRINKAGKPATLEDGVVGEDVSGYVKPTEDGKLNATTVNFGPKVGAKAAPKSPEKPAEKAPEKKDKV